MEKLYLICRVEVLLPDDGDIKSHVHQFTYVVNPRFFVDFYASITKEYDFYNIDQVCYFKSTSPKYFNKQFVRL